MLTSVHIAQAALILRAIIDIGWLVAPVSGLTPLTVSSVKALVAPRNMLSVILSRWPRKRSHGPAGEMWSVVVLPLVLTRIGRSMKSLPSHATNGPNT